MNPLIIPAEDDTTPSVRLDSVKNTFEISGWSHPEDAISFYAPVFEWLEVYVRSPNEKTDFHFNLQYYNIYDIYNRNKIAKTLYCIILYLPKGMTYFYTYTSKSFTYSKHFSSASSTNALGSWFTILHCDLFFIFH